MSSPISPDAPSDPKSGHPEAVSAGEQRARKLQEIKIFISSPGDVGDEREIAARVIKCLAYEFQAWAKLTPILWGSQAIVSTDTFQEQISRPSEADIVFLYSLDTPRHTPSRRL